MGVLLMLMVFVIALAAGLTLVLGRSAGRHSALSSRAVDHQELRYAVPPGQDPASLTAALSGDGFDSAVTLDGTRRILVIDCPHGRGRDRSTVRALLERSGSTVQDPAPMAGPVLFLDEEQSGL